jgi:hypothetical protein
MEGSREADQQQRRDDFGATEVASCKGLPSDQGDF